MKQIADLFHDRHVLAFYFLRQLNYYFGSGEGEREASMT
jgi:hypothetical protein